MRIFDSKNLLEIYKFLEQELKQNSIISFLAPNPDIDSSSISIKSWADLAEIFKCKLLTPKIKNSYIELTFKKLNSSNSFHSSKVANISEKYGVDSAFFNIDKTKHPYFLHSFIQALNLVNFKQRENILNLGINRGDEFKLIKELLSNDEFKKLNLIGIDYCKSAIEYAKKHFNYSNVKFINCNINKLDTLNLKRQDLIISIGTLQSSTLNYKPLLMDLVQNYLKKDAAIILGFPNGRWIDDTLIYGAKIKNYSFSEMGVLINDIHFAKKYLQQKKFKVFISGREYIFLSAYRED